MFPCILSVPCDPSFTMFSLPCILHCSLVTLLDSVPYSLAPFLFPLILPLLCSVIPVQCSLQPALFPGYRTGLCSMFPCTLSVPFDPSFTLLSVPCNLHCSLATLLDSVLCSLAPFLFLLILPLLCSVFPATFTVPWRPYWTLFYVPLHPFCSL